MDSEGVGNVLGEGDAGIGGDVEALEAGNGAGGGVDVTLELAADVA